MSNYNVNGYDEQKAIEPEPEHIQRQKAGLPPKAKTSAQRQQDYRNRLKTKLGEKEFKKVQAENMKKYRKKNNENLSVDENKISNKETRDKVNTLLKNIQERVIQMINEQKQNPQIAIHFEDHIRPEDISPVLVNISNDMSNEQVVEAFAENERKNPKKLHKFAVKETFIKYLDTIQRLRRLYFGIKDPKVKVYHDFEWLKNTDKVVKLLQEKYTNLNSLSAMINAISATLSRLNHYQDIYINTYKNLNIKYAIDKKEHQLQKENVLTDEEKAVFMKWNDILNLEDAVKNTDINPVENIAIFYLYTQIPPRRVADYANLVINNENDSIDNDKLNYVVLNKNKTKVEKIVLNKYKTAKTYKRYIVQTVPPKLSQAIIDLINEQGYKPGEYLFQNQNGKPYGEAFSARIKRVFQDACGKNITANVLRHSFISYHLQGNVSANQKKKYAEAMGHTVETQAEYIRFDKEELGMQ